MMVDLRPGERIDDLERNGLKIIQSPGKFCFGMDAVLLSAYVRVAPGDRVLDLGTGTGIIPILLSAKTQAAHLTGLELLPENTERARRSVQMNGLGERIEIVTGDIREAAKLFDAASFDVVTANPPYIKNEHGLLNPDADLCVAKHEICCTLEDVVHAAGRCLKEGGCFTMVHRPFRLTDILETMRQSRLEPKRMRLVYPAKDKAPSLVLIEGRKGGGAFLTVEEPLIIYEKDGEYTGEVAKIYGKG